MQTLQKFLNLLNLKSVVTLTLTAIFGYLSIVGKITPEQYMTIFTVVIGFYFGSVTRKDDK